MEIEQNTAAPDDGAVDQQFYGITKDGLICHLPEAPYASDAIRYYQEHDEKPLRLELVLNQNQYDQVITAIKAELDDVDGDTLIPTYFIIPFHTLQPVFAHPSVDTEAEVAEWVTNFIKVPEGEDSVIQILGPFTLEHTKTNWPPASGEEPARFPGTKFL